MVLRGNSVVWIPTANQVQHQPQHEEEADDTLSSWTQNNQNQNDNVVLNASTNFKSMLETDWYLNPLNTQHQEIQNTFIHGGLINNTHQDMREFTSFVTNNTSAGNNNNNNNNGSTFVLQPMDSSSSCSPSQQCFTSLLNLTTPPSPFDNAFVSGFEPSFLGHYQGGGSGLLDFQAAQLLPLDDTNGESSGFGHVGFEGFDGNGLFFNRVSKGLKPLEGFPEQQQQPTLFQKRAMLRQSSEKLGNLEVSGLRYGGEVGGNWGDLERKRKRFELEGEVEEGSFDVSGFNYDSDDRNVESKFEENGGNDGGSNSNANSTVTATGGGAHQKGKKKGMPAKNLMAERRRRKKLNDRLYMLRSVVPKISKMDRASILGDAIDYLKELLQRINDLHNELESSNPGSMAPPSMNFHPLTPTPSTLPCRVKEELCPASLQSPKVQPARVEVKLREGRAVNIHMFCSRRPGLLLSTMRALDNLGLDIQQAVISCFNGFALDVFRAEQCSEGQDVLPEQIKAVLLDSAGFHGVM